MLERYEDPVETPHDGYERIGIRSHAKGVFHSYVEPGKELDTAKMHKVAADKFILNITFAWEHAVAITEEEDAGTLVSHRFPQFSFHKELKSHFFKFLMLDRKFREYLELCSPGGAGRNRVLNINDMLKYKINVPSVEEQTKIGEYFDNLDNLITLHQRKCFPRIIGTKSPVFHKNTCYSTNGWEQRKLGEEFERVNERNNGQFGITHWISVAKMYYQEPDKVQSNNLDTRTYVMRKGDIAFEGHPNSEFQFGRFVANDIGDGIISELFPIYRHKVPYENSYWKYAIQIERVMRPIYAKAITSSGASSNKLNEEHFLRESIFVPKLDEQRAIGGFFTDLDNLITLHQCKPLHF